MRKTDVLLLEALQEQGLLPQDTLASLRAELAATDAPLVQLIIARRLLREKEVLQILGRKLQMDFVDLQTAVVDKAVIELVPVKIASYYKFMPVSLKGRVLTVAASNPLDIKTQDDIRTQLGYDIDMVLATESDITQAYQRFYGLAADTLGQIVSQSAAGAVSSFTEALDKIEDIEKLAGDASVVKLVNQIILDAFRKRSTDIHIEPYRNSLVLRYRVDGILYDAKVPPEFKSFLAAIISRIKIMSNLNIVERRLPQDGRAVVKIQDQVLDLRISTIPTPYGESMVIRILPTNMLFSLEKLGLGHRELTMFEKLIQKPHGVIFVTGPTGSGKTTTLYACLSRINTKARKIITIEDPIEYEMDGITQIQVMSEIGLDFARGLRSMLRHDPDVMMVGEVRDLETAEIAIRVALTGHLVFSTLHTNDAASGITRLIDIGVEPYLVASSIEAFIAQRLIRVLCPDCKDEDTKAPAELKELIAKEVGTVSADKVKVFRSKGCPSCNNTGFYGRTAIYEILLVDEEIQDLVVKKASAGQIKRAALAKGMRTLRQDGWLKVLAGVTTPEEIMKVASAEKEPVTAQKEESFVLPVKEIVAQKKPFIESRLEPASSDRRVYLRLEAKVNIHYQVFESEADLAARGFKPEQISITKNISAGGLLFVADRSLPAGALLDVRIELPDAGKPVECLARVIRVDENKQGHFYNVAVCFLDITSSDRARVGKYVQEELTGEDAKE